MQSSKVEELDRSLAQTWQWLTAIDERMNVQNPRLAMSALQCTLKALRQQLGTEQAARFAENLPIPLKGVFFEGWHPAMVQPATSRQELLDRLDGVGVRGFEVSAEKAIKASLEVIAEQIPAVEMQPLAAALPDDLQSLWPNEAPYAKSLHVKQR